MGSLGGRLADAAYATVLAGVAYPVLMVLIYAAALHVAVGVEVFTGLKVVDRILTRVERVMGAGKPFVIPLHLIIGNPLAAVVLFLPVCLVVEAWYWGPDSLKLRVLFALAVYAILARLTLAGIGRLAIAALDRFL